MSQLMDRGVREEDTRRTGGPIPRDVRLRVPRGDRLHGRDAELAELARMLSDPGIRLLTVTGPAGVGKSALARFALGGGAAYGGATPFGDTTAYGDSTSYGRTASDEGATSYGRTTSSEEATPYASPAVRGGTTPGPGPAAPGDTTSYGGGAGAGDAAARRAEAARDATAVSLPLPFPGPYPFLGFLGHPPLLERVPAPRRAAGPGPAPGAVVVGVDLASTGSRGTAWRAVAAALGAPGRPVADAPVDALPELIGAHLGDREVLLVLDNGDLVASRLPGDIAALLRRCPRLRILLTSRSSLDVSAEHLFPVTPLPVGPRGGAPLDSVAVRLFVDRVGAHYRRDVLQPTELRNIAEICAELDGLPLAIEVTARAVGTVGTGALLAALRRGEYPYHGRLLDVPTRHQSVPGALSWGDRALSGEERSLLRRLAVCEVAIDLLTVQRLGGLSRMQAARRLDSLVRRSLLVSAKREGGDPEFRMLTAVRSYYRRQLAQSPQEAAEAYRRHAEHYAKLAGAAEQGLRDTEERARWLAAVPTRLSDLRVAVTRLQAAGRHATALRTLLSLEAALAVHDALPMAAELLERSVAAMEAEGAARDGGVLADALRVSAGWALAADDRPRAAALLSRAAALYERAGDPVGVAQTGVLAAELARRLGDTETAQARALSAVAAAETRRDVRGAAAARRVLALARADRGAADAEEPLSRALDELRSLRDPHATALALIDLARVRSALGRGAPARAAVREAMELLLLHGGSPAEVVLALEIAVRTAPGGGGVERRHVQRVTALVRALRERYALPGDGLADDGTGPDGVGRTGGPARGMVPEAPRAAGRVPAPRTPDRAGPPPPVEPRETSGGNGPAEPPTGFGGAKAPTGFGGAKGPDGSRRAEASVGSGRAEGERAGDAARAAAPPATAAAEPGDPAGHAAEPVDCPSLQSALTIALSTPPPAPDPAPEREGGEDPRLAGLTPRQHQIAELVAEGMTNRQIARALELSEWTVVNHLRQVMTKLECPSRVHVTRIVQRSAG
ncbi:LuxR C-terminal-related transcriptional regulator [Streptomyces sp. LX-29]|uniref:LuxR C-terminal-related transcriptional regulator n=1 Tax=Streptomyces sp. LX-29 TaxID=2900152 RepID=UPI00240E72F7|nr:LuxR C-terminal-related transcriptional regulator [Streptomyces sp. LX-29]WFB09459.1 LuxR C-terminal-related transcriptional regulator [Streptomyces sp. LX-29]